MQPVAAPRLANDALGRRHPPTERTKESMPLLRLSVSVYLQQQIMASPMVSSRNDSTSMATRMTEEVNSKFSEPCERC